MSDPQHENLDKTRAYSPCVKLPFHSYSVFQYRSFRVTHLHYIIFLFIIKGFCMCWPFIIICKGSLYVSVRVLHVCSSARTYAHQHIIEYTAGVSSDNTSSTRLCFCLCLFSKRQRDIVKRLQPRHSSGGEDDESASEK